MNLLNTSETPDQNSLLNDAYKVQLREFLHDLLLVSDIQVTFVKANGETRVMRCTLDPSVLPPHETNTDSPVDFPKPVNENMEVLRVWDLDKEAWRSFRIDSVVGFKA